MIATSSTIHVSAMFVDEKYGQLTPPEQAYIRARLDMCLRIDGEKKKRPAFVRESLRLHNGEKLSASNIRKLYYEKWIASGRDWWELRDKAKLPAVAGNVSEATLQKWHELVFEHGGKMRTAHRVLKRMWEQGKPIAGLPDAKDRTPDLPPGLSYDNLVKKKHRPTQLANRVAAIGLGAAGELLPGVLTTRVGLPFGARWVFDDIWHDFKVNVPGQKGARRLLQFHCIELLSACQAARGMKPELLNDHSGRMERLKEKELLFLLAHVFGSLGYCAEGCVAMMEHGTTNVDERVEKLLFDATGGKITVERGAISSSPLAPGLYAGRGRGNFKFKAALESLGNLVHNELSSRLDLPAQTGSNARLNAPEALHGIEKAHDALVLALSVLPPAMRELVRLPATPLWQAIDFADRVQEEMNRRTEHELEGWESAGFLLSEYRLSISHEWRPMTELLSLPAPLKAAIEAEIEKDQDKPARDRLSTARRLSPREVFDGLAIAQPLAKLPPHLIPQLVGMEHAKERAAAKDGQFHFDDMELGPDEHHFDGLVYTSDAADACVRIPAGEKFSTFASTIDPTRMHLCDAKGRYLGWVRRTLVASKADPHGFARACGAKAKAWNEMLAPVLAAAAPIMRAQRDAAQHNAAVFESAGQIQVPERAATLREKNARRASVDHTLAEAARAEENTEPTGSLYDASSDA